MWKWLITPAEPRGLYRLATGVFTAALMYFTIPFWSGKGLGAVAIAGGLSGGLGGALAKFLMEWRKK